MNNGNILKERFSIEIDGNELDKDLKHASTFNDHTSIKKDVIGYQKAKGHTGKKLIALIYALYFYTELAVDINSINGISSTSNLIEQIDEYYRINELIYLSYGEKLTKCKCYPENVCAVIYEVYNLCGFSTAYKLISPVLLNYNENIDYKTRLQEYVQAFKGKVLYELIGEVGAPNMKIFTVKVSALGREYTVQGSSKKRTEKEAAKKYLLVNKINYKSTENKSKNLLRVKRIWEVGLQREKEINIIRKNIKLKEKEIPSFILDACFTHKSYIRIHKNSESNDELHFIGSYVIDFYVNLYLLNNFNEICAESPNRFVAKAGMIVKAESLIKMYSSMFTSEVLNCINLVNEYKGEKSLFIPDIIKSILGGLYTNCLVYKNINFNECECLIKTFLSRIEVKQLDVVEYTCWIDDFSVRMGIDIKFINETQSGSTDNRIFYGEIKIFLSQYNLGDIVFKNESNSKKNLRFGLAKLFYFYMKKKFNINNLEMDIDKSESYTLLLRDFIMYSIENEQNAFYDANINILGGLCLKSWDINIARVIIDNLMYRMLFAEIKSIYSKWKMLYKQIDENVLFFNYDKSLFIDQSKEIEKTDLNNIVKEDIKFQSEANKDTEDDIKNEETVAIKSNKLKFQSKNSAFEEKSEKNAVIFTKAYYFENHTCMFCHSNLESVETLIQIKEGNKYKIFNFEILSCVICGIRGISREIEDALNRLNLKVSIYKGSPAFYASSIINMKIAKVFEMKKVKKRNKKTTSQEELDKQLLIRKKIGDEGEQFVITLEKKYLLEIGRADLADRIEWVSQIDCSAGYDILSYNEEGSPKYIEVKSTTSNIYSFFISCNEIQTAKVLGDSYFIYKVNNIRNNPYVIKIQNPNKNIESGEWIVKPTQYNVRIKQFKDIKE